MLRSLKRTRERFRIEAPSTAYIAKHPHVGQEAHLDLLHALAFTGLAASARGIEGEASRPVAADTRFGGFGEHAPDCIPEPDVGRRARARRLADRRLVDLEHTANLAPATHFATTGEPAPVLAIAVWRAEQSLEIVVQHITRERGFAGARDAGNCDQAAERHLGLDFLSDCARWRSRSRARDPNCVPRASEPADVPTAGRGSDP